MDARYYTFGAAAGVAVLILLGLTAAGRSTVYEAPSGPGVLLHPVAVTKQALPVEDVQHFEGSAKFAIESEADVPLGDFASSTPGVEVRVKDIQRTYKKMRRGQRRPVSMVIAMDNSGSMTMGGANIGNDPSYKRLDAAKSLLAAMPTSDRTGTVVFPAGSTVIDVSRVLSTFDSPKRTREELEFLRGNANGGTPLFHALQMSIEMLRREAPERYRVIVLLTDGNDNAPADARVALAAQAAEEAAAAEVTIFTIALGQSVDQSLLARLNGEDHVISAESSDQLTEAFSRISDQIETLPSGYVVELELVRRHQPFTPGSKVDVNFTENGVFSKSAVVVNPK